MRITHYPMLAPVIGAALLASAAARADAQTPRPAHLDTVYVGSVHLSNAYMHDDSSESLVVVPDSTAPGGQRVAGHTSSRWHVLHSPAPELARVMHFSARGNEVTDSIVTAGTGLVPISETSHQRAKVMHLRFAGTHVTGDVTPTGEPRQDVDQTLAVPAFNSSDISLLIASLPLSVGYSALVATYEIEAGGLRVDTLQVLRREAVPFGPASRTAYVVRVSRGGGAAMTDWIDAESRMLLKEEYSAPNGRVAMRLVRQP